MISPDFYLIDGRITKDFDEFAPMLESRPVLVPAQLRNNAGIVGAAMVAV